MKEAKVTVGIATLNGPDRLNRCLHSIRHFTRWSNVGSVKLLVHDDGSNEENLEKNKILVCNHYMDLYNTVGLEMLMTEGGTRGGIAKSWNKLVRHQASDVIILLNDDIEVSPDWLDVLVYSVWENPRAGMVGLNSYVGVTRSQHEATFRGAAHEACPRIDYVEAKLLSGNHNLLTSNGSAFAFRSSAFYDAGGFDERYFCYYEEVDFGVALRQKGYEHFICSYPILYHMGGATNSDETNLDAGAEMLRSREKFREKWGHPPLELRQKLESMPKRDSYPLREWNSTLSTLRD
jgi:GT2 family glycosyltransferase